MSSDDHPKRIGRPPMPPEQRRQTEVGSIRLAPEDWATLRELTVSGWLVPRLQRERKRRQRGE